MFADIALAARIEAAEARLTRDTVLALRDSCPGAFARELGSGVAAFVRAGSPMNKIIGVGIGAELDEAALDEIERQYRERGEPPRVELATLADADAGRLLTARGYRLMGFENVLGKPLAEAETAPRSTAIQVERAPDARAAEWRALLVEGFAHPDDTGVPADAFTRETIERCMDDILRAPGYDRYVASRAGAAAGAASMRLDGGVALLTGAATLAPHRGRGVQAALLARRLEDARRRGAELAVITTAPGTRSQANAARQGFCLLYARAVLVRE